MLWATIHLMSIMLSQTQKKNSAVFTILFLERNPAHTCNDWRSEPSSFVEFSWAPTGDSFLLVQSNFLRSIFPVLRCIQNSEPGQPKLEISAWIFIFSNSLKLSSFFSAGLFPLIVTDSFQSSWHQPIYDKLQLYGFSWLDITLMGYALAAADLKQWPTYSFKQIFQFNLETSFWATLHNQLDILVT